MAYKIIAKSANGFEEASWQISRKVVAKRNEHVSEKQPYQSADVVFEQSSVPVGFALRGDGMRFFLEPSEGTQRIELKPAELGHANAFKFLIETLEATASTGQRAIKLVAPSDRGNIIHAEVLPKRMQDIEYVEKTITFAHPLQSFNGDEWTSSTDIVSLFKSSIGAVRLRQVPSTQNVEATLDVLENELYSRLSSILTVPGLKRKTLVFVDGSNVRPHRGGYAAQFYGAAEAMGVDIVALGVDGHWLQGPEYSHYRKAFIPIEFGYDPGFPSRIAAGVRKYGGHVDAIMTIWDTFQIAVSKAATELGLYTEPTSAFEVIGNKYETSVFEGRKSFKVETHDEAMRIARTENLAWPIIVKPCRGFASELVMKLNNIDELAAAASNFGESARHGTDFVMEPYCDGPEVDINFIMYDGEVLFWEVGDEYPKSAEDGSNSFHELDCCSPCELPKAEQNVMHDTIVNSLLKLGFRNGLYHCEARVGDSTVEWRHTASGAQELAPKLKPSERPPSSFLIEVNYRPPGINSSDIIETTWGVDYFSVLIAIRLMDRERVHAMSKPYRQGPQYYGNMVFISALFDESKKGIWESGEVTEELCEQRPDLAKHISKHLTYMRKGDRVPHSTTGVNTFVAYLNLFSRESRKHVLDLSSEVRRELYRMIEWS